jgi:hypothetical protein
LRAENGPFLAKIKNQRGACREISRKTTSCCAPKSEVIIDGGDPKNLVYQATTDKPRAPLEVVREQPGRRVAEIGVVRFHRRSGRDVLNRPPQPRPRRTDNRRSLSRRGETSVTAYALTEIESLKRVERASGKIPLGFDPVSI